MARIRRRFGTITASFEPAEARVLRSLVAEVSELLSQRSAALRRTQADEGGAPDPLAEMVGMNLSWDEQAAGDPADSPAALPPEDPALARLLPDAYPDDGEFSGEFRRLTESSLRDGKVAAAARLLETLPETGGTVRIDEETAHIWTSAINDVRLALGTRLGVTEETPMDVDPRDAADQLMAIYVWLGFIQQQLVDAVTGFRSPF